MILHFDSVNFKYLSKTARKKKKNCPENVAVSLFIHSLTSKGRYRHTELCSLAVIAEDLVMAGGATEISWILIPDETLIYCAV